MKQTEALTLALEALKRVKIEFSIHQMDTAITAIKKALAQPEQEPVALPDDFELLPVDPTPEMKSAAIEAKLKEKNT